VTRHSYTQQIADYLKARPLVWIPAVSLESVGGRQAWRTRVSEARRAGMVIQNRVLRMSNGREHWRESQYRYIPPTTRLEQDEAGGWTLTA